MAASRGDLVKQLNLNKDDSDALTSHLEEYFDKSDDSQDTNTDLEFSNASSK